MLMNNKEYFEILEEIKQQIRATQYRAVLGMNREQIILYWNIGKTIIINTLEIPEIQQIADRCAVFYHGEHLVILDRKDINEENVMFYATGASQVNNNVANDA